MADSAPQAKLGPWYTTGPLKAQAFGDVFFPEKGVDLTAKDPAGQPLWTAHPEWAVRLPAFVFAVLGIDVSFPHDHHR